METLTTVLKWVASGGGIVAAAMISFDFGRRVTGWGLVLFAVSALMWIAGAIITEDFALGTQNAVLFCIDVYGAYRYLIRKKENG